jgi:hypothetical protein
MLRNSIPAAVQWQFDFARAHSPREHVRGILSDVGRHVGSRPPRCNRLIEFSDIPQVPIVNEWKLTWISRPPDSARAPTG